MTLIRAYFKNLETKEEMKVQFNPTDLTFNKTAQFAEIAIPGLDAPVQQFVRGGAETLTVELFFDTTDDGMDENATSVTTWTDRFYQLVKQNRDTHAPPRCLFGWGQPSYETDSAGQVLIKKDESGKEVGRSLAKDVSHAPSWFTCIVESIDRKFLLFSPKGVPLRARLTVKMREYQTVEQMVLPLKSSDHTKARVFKSRDRLDRISANEYDTPAEWRRIAEENNLDDPRRILPGTILKIPPIRGDTDRRRQTDG